jgi:hypothetical protein
MPVRAAVYLLALAASALAHGWQALAFPALLIGGFEAVQLYLKQRKSTRWHGWPATLGIVESVNVRRDRIYFAELGYGYSVDGERYSGFHQTGFDGEEPAWEFCRALAGTNVEVRYDPKEPRISLLAI